MPTGTASRPEREVDWENPAERDLVVDHIMQGLQCPVCGQRGMWKVPPDYAYPLLMRCQNCDYESPLRAFHRRR